ncbi:MAG: efflux RND transporter periplasmic adaptor subunit [Gemmatimonadaceae bacterium]|jgi:Cu(I)/Ag(I) efflux system membrane fusion protein|nr:efflux RND transporter periplasmic adaptor subunit [Gemmatimonadaceae bacterium]
MSVTVPPAPSRGHRVRRIALSLAFPAAAAGIAWYVTRDDAPLTASTAAHDHAAMSGAPGRDGPRPVQLTPDQARRIGITFAAVEATPLAREIRTVGQVVVDETRVQTVSLKVEGWVETLHADFTGRAIRRGEPLLRLYSPALVTAQEELLLARRLVRDVEAGTADTRAGADDLVAGARRRLAYWDVPPEEIARIERTGEVQRTVTLRSPASGVITEKRVTAGQRVMAGEPLLRVADLSTVWVEGEVYEQDLRAVRTGQPATAEFDAWPGEAWPGRIAYVYPTLSPETRTTRVRVALANGDGRLRPGMYATLRVRGAADTGAPGLTVPRNAVLVTGERALVFRRLANGTLEPREVHVGTAAGDRIEIVRGLAVGDTVVASATFLLDAESNLGTALGGMGDMPGMEVIVPRTRDTARARSGTPAPRPMDPSMPMDMPMPGAPRPATQPRGTPRAPGSDPSRHEGHTMPVPAPAAGAHVHPSTAG